MMLYNYITNDCTNDGHFMAVDQVSIIHVINSCKLQYIVEICSCNMYFYAFSEGGFKKPLEPLAYTVYVIGGCPPSMPGVCATLKWLTPHIAHCIQHCTHTSKTLLTEIPVYHMMRYSSVHTSTDCRQVSAMPDDHPLILGVGLEITFK